MDDGGDGGSDVPETPAVGSGSDGEAGEIGSETGAGTGGPFAPAIDCHVHLLPDRLLAAIRRALFEAAGWEIDHPTDREGIEATLRAAGVERYCTLPYAHEPGMARELNDWVLARAGESPMAVPFATVHPGDDVRRVVRAAFDAGARGLKFQCPVQECGPADPRLDPAFELAAERDRPILFHAGTAPTFEDSPHVGPDRFGEFVASYPEVRAACAHMGAFETDAFLALAREHDPVYLDTSFATSDAVGRYVEFDPASIPDGTLVELSGSIMYGSDYPNVPHGYAAERRGLLARDLPRETYRDLFSRTAERFLGER